jgi:RimJ/RimL family protein N-acetyltransferase
MIGVMDVAGSPAEQLTSDGVVLRRWRAADAGLAYRLVSESAVYLRPWMPWAADYTPETARAFTESCEQDWASGATFNYLIRHAGAPAGSAGLMTRRGPAVLEIGYWVHPEHAGQGVATAAADALTRAAFGLPGIGRVEIIHDLNNAASAQVPRKLGYARVGTEPGRFGRAPGECGTASVWRIMRPAG